jgi:hypothetical protein
VHLGRHELPVADTELVEVTIDLSGSASRDDHGREPVADLIYDLFEFHESFEEGVTTGYPMTTP